MNLLTYIQEFCNR